MSSIAPILEHSTGKIRFGVDDVQPAIERLPAISARLQFEQILTTPLLAFSHDDTFESIANREIHPLAFAVHSAFSEHRPLVLTPDIIWLTIAQGFAHHLNNYAEKFRSNFVSHQGKEQLVISGNNLPTSPAQWAEIVEQWTLHLRDRVGADVYQLIECNFSPITQITRIASHVVMMDAFKQYFDYVVRCVCGIPEISLLGTVADWQDSQHSWHILPVQLWEQNWVDDLILPEIFCYFYAYPFIAVNDGRSIAYNFNYDSQQCSFLVGNQVDNKFESDTIVATSATELFERILAADGAYYFDDPSFLA